MMAFRPPCNTTCAASSSPTNTRDPMRLGEGEGEGGRGRRGRGRRGRGERGGGGGREEGEEGGREGEGTEASLGHSLLYSRN